MNLGCITRHLRIILSYSYLKYEFQNDGSNLSRYPTQIHDVRSWDWYQFALQNLLKKSVKNRLKIICG